MRPLSRFHGVCRRAVVLTVLLAGVRAVLAEPPLPPLIVVSGTPAVVSAPALWHARTTFTFAIRAPQEAAENVVIGSSGLGDVRFQLHGTKESARFLVLPKVTKDEQLIFVRVERGVFPWVVGTTTAKLNVWTTRGTVEVPLVLGPNVFITGTLWFFGFLTPALAGGLISYVNVRRQAKAKEADEEAKARQLALNAYAGAITRYFDNLYVETWRFHGRNPAVWGAKIRAALLPEWLSGVSADDSEELKAALSQGEPLRVCRILCRLFPAWKNSINAVHKVEPDGEV